MAIPPFGGAPTPDATAVKKGKLRLAGDLAGTATTPALASIIVAGSVGSSSLIPVLTYDAKGRITVATTAAVTAGLTFETAYFLGC